MSWTATEESNATAGAYAVELAVFAGPLYESLKASLTGYTEGSLPTGFIAPSTPTGSDLVTNGGFETFTGTADDGTSDTFTGWTSDGVDAVDLVEATATKHAGTYAVKITTTNGPPGVYQDIAVTAGKSYVLGCYARGDGTAHGNYGVYDNINAAWVRENISTGVTGTSYAAVSGVFMAPAGCTSVRIWLIGEISVSGVVYFDAVTLYELTSAWAAPANWTDLSARTTYAGQLAYERAGSAHRWQLQLRGWDFDAAYLGTGRTIVVIRRIVVAGVAQAWGLWCIGAITADSASDTYRHGGQWQVTVRGSDSLLERANAPRLALGPVELLSNGSVTATSTLATPTLEAGNGEFKGATANVDAANVNDGSVNTVWISADIPSITGETSAGSDIVIDKVFLTPIAGYDQTKLWWLEIYNAGVADVSMQGTVNWWLKNEAGIFFAWKWSDAGPCTLKAGERGIVCASLADFEAYTGGAREAAWVVEAKSWRRQGIGAPNGALDGTPFVLNPTAGYVQLWGDALGDVQDTVAWDQAGADPSLTGWTGPAINISTLTAGYCLRRKPTGTDTGEDGDWYFEQYYEPGGYAASGQNEALLLDPGAQDAALSQDETAGATTLHLTHTNGWPDAGDGICEADTFSYTGRTSLTLTGVTGLASNHSTGAACYPTVGGVTMYGWPCARLELGRLPGLSTLKNVRVYIQKASNSAPRMPDESGWESDYDAAYLQAAGNTQSVLSFSLLGPAGENYRWVRRALVVIRRMSDDGRAKLNWARLWLAQSELNASGAGDLDGVRSADVAEYLVVTQYGLTAFTSQLVPSTHGILGSHATAILPYAAVLEDLARVTGCVVRYRLDGRVAWRPDPWWPLGLADEQLTPYATLGAEHVRGEARFAGQQPSTVGVTVNARTPDGLQSFSATFPPGATADGPVTTVDGLVVTEQGDVRWLAESAYQRLGLNVLAGATRCTLTLTGPGEWLRPDHWLELVADLDTRELALSNTAGTTDVSGWLVERVTWAWSSTLAGHHTWTATAELVRFRR